MVGRCTTNSSFVTKQEEADISPENSGDSPVSASPKNRKVIPLALSAKKSKRAMHKRVVSIPIKEVEASRLKGETTPPSDSWAWRKYGQKPIKGSPYPRGYYRCSGSKGCPARKQVERNHLDPTMLLVTYSSEHNHPLPSSSSRSHHHTSSAAAAAKHDDDNTTYLDKASDEDDTSKPVDETNEEDKFDDLGEDSLLTDEFRGSGWFADVESTSATRLLESPLFMEMGGTDLGEMIVMQEEDESLFADLGELPEFSVVFRRRTAEEGEKNRLSTAADRWCGTNTL